MLVVTIVVCAGIGLGVGELLGAPAPFLVAGVIIGFGAGLFVVISRFKDI